MRGAPSPAETASVLAAPSSGSSPCHGSQHVPCFVRATSSPTHSSSSSSNHNHHHHHHHHSSTSNNHDSAASKGKVDDPAKLPVASTPGATCSSSASSPASTSISNSHSNPSNPASNLNLVKSESTKSGFSGLECIDAAELMLPSMVPEDTGAKRSSGAGSSTAAPTSVRSKAFSLSNRSLSTSEDCATIDWATFAATPSNQSKLNPAKEHDALVKAARTLRSRAHQQVEEASGDNELRGQLLARLREMDAILRLISEHLLKGHLLRIVNTLKELSEAVDSWETSKGFPFLRGESTTTELSRQKQHLQKLLDEAHSRAVETGHADLLPRGTASTGIGSWAAGGISSTNVVGSSGGGAGASVSASSWLSGETTDTLKSLANYTTEVEELPRGEAAAAATRPRSPPSPTARWSSKGSRRCVLVVQKAPELPGQLQQEWEQASVTSRGHLKAIGPNDREQEDDERLSKQSSVLSLC